MLLNLVLRLLVLVSTIASLHGAAKSVNDITFAEFIPTLDEIDQFYTYAYFGAVEEVKLAIANKIDVNCIDPDYKITALRNAASGGHIEIVKILIEAKAIIDLKGDKFENTPLSKAGADGHELIVELLIKHNAEINAKNIFQSTPLHNALMVSKVKPSIVKALINAKADVNLKDNVQRTPLNYAVRNAGEYVDILLKAGADLNFDYFFEVSLELPISALQQIKIANQIDDYRAILLAQLPQIISNFTPLYEALAQIITQYAVGKKE